MRSPGQSWASDSNPRMMPCSRPSSELILHNASRTHYTKSGHRRAHGAIPVFRLGCNCGNDREGQLSVRVPLLAMAKVEVGMLVKKLGGEG